MEKRDAWSKIDIGANVLSAILVPALLLIFGSIITSQQHAAQLAAQARADFDKVIVDDVINLHKEILSYLIVDDKEASLSLQKNASGSFYDKVELQLSSLQLRFRVSRYDGISEKQIALLKDTISDIRRLEEMEGGQLKPEVVSTIRDLIDTSFAAILKLELAKSRGEITIQ